MADFTRDSKGLDRREFLTAATLAGASAMVLGPNAAAAAAERYPAIRKAAEAGRDAAIKRIQDWIALPSIAAENRSMKEGAEYMANLAREAGFDTATIVPTDGHPGVFATMDNGAKRTLALYFMYDVKQFDPAEWSSPPLEARIVDKPGFGRAIVGRGAVNQKGPEATVLAALHAMRAAKAKLPVNLVLVCRGRRGNRLAALSPDRAASRSVCRAQEGRGHLHSRQLAGHERQRLRQSGLEGHHRAGAGRERREVGSRAQGRHSLQPESERRLAGLATGAALNSLVTPDGNTPVIDGWFENVRPLTAREKELIAESRAQQRRSSAEETARRQRAGSTTCPTARRSSDWPRNRR